MNERQSSWKISYVRFVNGFYEKDVRERERHWNILERKWNEMKKWIPQRHCIWEHRGHCPMQFGHRSTEPTRLIMLSKLPKPSPFRTQSPCNETILRLPFSRTVTVARTMDDQQKCNFSSEMYYFENDFICLNWILNYLSCLLGLIGSAGTNGISKTKLDELIDGSYRCERFAILLLSNETMQVLVGAGPDSVLNTKVALSCFSQFDREHHKSW